MLCFIFLNIMNEMQIMNVNKGDYNLLYVSLGYIRTKLAFIIIIVREHIVELDTEIKDIKLDITFMNKEEIQPYYLNNRVSLQAFYIRLFNAEKRYLEDNLHICFSGILRAVEKYKNKGDDYIISHAY